MSELEHASHESARYFFDRSGALWEYLGRFPQPSIALQRVGTSELPISGHTRVEVDPCSPWAGDWHLGGREAVEAFMAKRAPVDALVARFSEALRAKLHAAEAKHGWDNAWLRPHWREDLLRELTAHIDKGDPLDVAAYSAFAWHHGWALSTVRPDAAATAPAIASPLPWAGTFIGWMADRFQQKHVPALAREAALAMAVHTLEAWEHTEGVYGTPDFDWSEDAAHVLADTEIEHWESAA